MGVGSCEWPNLWIMRRRILASRVLRNNAPNYASAADAGANFRMAHVMWTFPFNWMGFPSIIMLPRKK